MRPEACQRCGKECRTQAHHDDHSKPLDVMWLCPVCHAARHGEIGRLITVSAIYPDKARAFYDNTNRP